MRPKVYSRSNPDRFKNIPAELKALPQWVAWRQQQRENDKTAKVPVSPVPGLPEASISDPSSWRTFQEALKVFKDNEELSGIGFVFSPQDQFTGIDIDDCRDSLTGQFSDKAMLIIQQFNSYTEISPSGTGVKIFIKGDLAGKTRTRRGGIEMYSHSRYFTMTGWHVEETPRKIESRQGPLMDLYTEVFGRNKEEKKPSPTPQETDPLLERVRAITDEELIEKMLTRRKVRLLWEGSLVGYPSHSEADFALCCQLAYWTRADATRIDRLFRKSKLYRTKWEEEQYRRRTIAASCTSEKSRYDPTISGVSDIVKNDISNTKIFTDLCGENFLYVKEWAEWMTWNGIFWRRNSKDDLHHEAATRVSQELLRRALIVPSDARPKEINWALKAGGSGPATAIESFARSQLLISPDVLDAQTMLLACGNGVIDLKTGELRRGHPEDYLTRGTGIEYDSKIKCPRFDNFLSEIMLGDKEMVAYLWRVLGYCLTGETHEHVFFILHGNGLNGKSTFVDLLQALLGDLSQSARFQTFLSMGNAGGSGPNDDVAHLAGARIVMALEADEAARLNSALIKNLTGGDAVRARFLYGKEFQFKPRLKLFLVSNYVPRIDDTSLAIWRRVHYIPFKYQVPEDKIDSGLSLKLYGELEGILAKAVQGCLEWQKKGLAFPAGGREATKQLREESDIVGAAIEELCVRGDAAHSKMDHRYFMDQLTRWYSNNNYRFAPKSHLIIKDLRRRGFVEKRGTGNRLFWYGIELRQAARIEVDMEL